MFEARIRKNALKAKSEALPFDIAQSAIMEHISPILRRAEVPIALASGRVLTHDIYASTSIPSFSRSAMDGYAVKAADIASASPESPVALRLTESVFAASIPSHSVSTGECTAVTTGSMMPEGADAVVRLEDTTCNEDVVSVMTAVGPDANVALAASDIKQGELLLKGGTTLDPGKIGILASQGISSIEVYAKPNIAILSTGDELAAVGSGLKAGQIYDINSSTLFSLIGENGGNPFIFPIIDDDPTQLIKNLDATTADAVVVSGGSSVGEKDLVLDVLKIMGEVIVPRIRIKPGPPTAFAIVNGKPVFCLPGPPTACLMNAYLLLVPAIRKIARLPVSKHRPIKARLLKQATRKSDIAKSFPVQLVGDMALPVFKKAGDIACTGRADGYILVPENIEAEKDSEVMVTLF